MGLVVGIDLIVLAVLVGTILAKGLEDALPVAAFFCVLVPPAARLPLGGIFELSPQRIILLVLLGGFALWRRPAAQVKSTPLKWLIAAQVVWALVSTADSIVPEASAKKLLAEVLEYYLLYIIYVRTVSSVRTIYRILYAFICALFICSIFGDIDAYLGWDVMSIFPSQSSRIMLALGLTASRGRVASTFPHPILFGTALALGITIALHLLKTAKLPRAAFLWSAILLMFMNIYKTRSRGAWLGLILALVMLLVLERGKVRKYILVIGALTVFVLVVRPGVYQSLMDIYRASFDAKWGNLEGLSVDYRFELRRVAQAALARDFRRQLWGYGMESFVDLQLEGELGGHRFPFLSCDSAWLELMVETGYVGLFLIAILLLRPAFLAWKDFRRLPHKDRSLSLTLLVTLTVYYFMMLSVDMYGWGQEANMLWILIAMSIVYSRLGKTNPRPDTMSVSGPEPDTTLAENSSRSDAVLILDERVQC